MSWMRPSRGSTVFRFSCSRWPCAYHLAALLNAMRVSGQIGERELRDFVSAVHPGAEDFADEES